MSPRAALGRLIAAAAALLLWPCSALADQWLPPKTETYVSPGKRARLTVTPRPLAGILPYFDDKVRGREPAGQAAGSDAQTPGAVLEKREGGRRKVVWRGPLVKDVAPAAALVPDSGRYAVTFDNWHSAGWGHETVVIYGDRGQHIGSLGLGDFLPEVYVNALPRSISSIWWGGEHRFSSDGARLVLQVVVPARDALDGDRLYVEREIDLAGGRPLPPAGRAWEEALAAAVRVDAADRAADARAAARRAAPLLGPETAEEGPWHSYLVEAFFRVDPAWSGGYPGTAVLRSPDARDYKVSIGWVRKMLGRPAGHGDARMFASPSQENLARVFAEALAYTGALFIQLDPREPIPQRPERLP